MSLQPGIRLGPYEILSPLGAGGMGEIWKARDTRLDRVVAIKVLPEQLSADPQLRARLDREARAISSLNHPHICTLYDVGHQDGIDFLVLEYLEGRTLADRIAAGPLPMREAMSIAIQTADALDKAHRAGIVHRDLKTGEHLSDQNGGEAVGFWSGPDRRDTDPDRRSLTARAGVGAADDAAQPDVARHPARNVSLHGARANRRT